MMPGLRIPRPWGQSPRHLRTLACMLGTVALGACASAGRLEHVPDPVASRVVVNNYTHDRVTLFVARGGSVERLGEVNALGDSSFPIPQWAVAGLADVYFVARPLAGRPYRSESFAFPRGATAVWTIQGPSALSYVSLR